MTNPRWEVEGFFDGFGGALFDLTVFRIPIYAEDVVKHVLVLYGSCLCGASLFDTFLLIVNEVDL